MTIAVVTTQGREANAQQVSEVVLGWVRAAAPDELPEQVEQWQAAQWEAARWAIQVHGLAPLLYTCLHRSLAWDALAPSLQHYLAEQQQTNTQRMALMLAELGSVLRAAEAAGIPAVPLKGSIMATQYYPDPALRPMADLDLLVHPADATRMDVLLRDVGYQLDETTDHHRCYVRVETGSRPVFTDGEHIDNPRKLELHSSVTEQFGSIGCDMTATIWANCRPARFGTATALLIEPATLLQHLLIHTGMDLVACKARLIRSYDLPLVAARMNDEDWQTLLQNARRSGEERLYYAALAVATRYLGPFAPEPVLAALAAGTAPRLRAYLERTTLSQLSFCNPLPSTLADKLSWYRSRREQIGALRAMVLPPHREMRHAYPELDHPARLLLAYLSYGLRVLAWPLRRLLRQPRRSWLRRDYGGR